jgi:hypothetical protein
LVVKAALETTAKIDRLDEVNKSGKCQFNAPARFCTINTYAPDPRAVIARKGQILKGLCPDLGFGPLSPVAYVRRAMVLRMGAAGARKAFDVNWEEKEDEGWHTRRERNRGSVCAILMT